MYLENFIQNDDKIIEYLISAINQMVINQRLTTEIGYRRHRKTVKFFKRSKSIKIPLTRKDLRR